MLELQNISYMVDDDNKEILRDINLAFDEKFVAITGPNGSGKTTLIKLINGLLAPTKGELFINGNAPGVETKKIVSYLPERTYLDETQKD